MKTEKSGNSHGSHAHASNSTSEKCWKDAQNTNLNKEDNYI